ncbi:MAG: type Z 30S ribosomal protein S14 [bacterium]
MTRKALINKSKAKPKFTTRVIRRCQICGRGHSVMRDFGVCRICFREMARNGQLPGIKKASW